MRAVSRAATAPDGSPRHAAAHAQVRASGRRNERTQSGRAAPPRAATALDAGHLPTGQRARRLAGGRGGVSHLCAQRAARGAGGAAQRRRQRRRPRARGRWLAADGARRAQRAGARRRLAAERRHGAVRRHAARRGAPRGTEGVRHGGAVLDAGRGGGRRRAQRGGGAGGVAGAHGAPRRRAARRRRAAPRGARGERAARAGAAAAPLCARRALGRAAEGGARAAVCGRAGAGGAPLCAARGGDAPGTAAGRGPLHVRRVRRRRTRVAVVRRRARHACAAAARAAPRRVSAVLRHITAARCRPHSRARASFCSTPRPSPPCRLFPSAAPPLPLRCAAPLMAPSPPSPLLFVAAAPPVSVARASHHPTPLAVASSSFVVAATRRRRPPLRFPASRAMSARVYARADTGTTHEEAVAAATARHSYAVASGDNLNLTATPPRRVALLVEPSPFTHTSGYSNRFKNLIVQLRAAGDQVLVIVPDNDRHAPTEFAGARIVNVPGFRFPLYRRITLTLGLRGVYRALKDFDPDVIHLTTPGFLIFATLLFARLLRKALLLSYHTHLPIYAKDYGLGSMQRFIWTMLRLQHNRADFTLTTSPQLCEELVRNGFQRVGLWRKGIDTVVFHPRFKSASMRERLTEGHAHQPLLIYVGRIGAEKNLIFFKQLMRRFAHCRLALVGDGPYKRTLQSELAGTNTVFTGILHGEQLSSAFASADVFVMPSESETLGFVVLESMACGVPVVGANAGGIPDIINHGVDGFLFDAGSQEQCAQRVQQLLHDKPLRDAMGAAARAEALKWSWSASAAATRNVGYGRAISNFKYRAMGGLGLPRSLTWLRWVRLKLVMLKRRLFGRLLWAINAH
eukprot:TRINITY_DN15_c0_g5_i2.p1 TRINITY_DN15_c0_g5~~TRINITY_DN15_c0_g5_i2.p1  ORF type:complete len:856 (+),score=192.50 TRINITY_DN15_c0_g5_i2:223-2790(+)